MANFFCRIRPLIARTIRTNTNELLTLTQNGRVAQSAAAAVHTTARQYGLSEFFDMDNLNASKVPVGRPWRTDELRLKSNTDLHKLWYVLLKERNMLMTMEELHKSEDYMLPSPERVYKVDESMENLLEVLRERDIAYNLLETGTSGEKDSYVLRNLVGIPYKRKPTEHYLPKHANARFKKLHPDYQKWMGPYLDLYEEKLRVQEGYKKMKFAKKVKILYEKYPDLSQEEVEALRPHLYKLEEYITLSGQLGDRQDKPD